MSITPQRPEIVATFLATLELSRLKKMRLFQEKTYEEIYIELLESLRGFDENVASGFDNPNKPAEEGAGEGFVDDRRAAMDLSGAVEFTPIAQLAAELAQVEEGAGAK